MRARTEGIRVGAVGVGYWGSRHVRVLRTTTGMATVIGVDQRFAEIGDGRRGPEHGVTVYADVEHNAAVHKLRDLVRGGHLGRLFCLNCARPNLGL